MAIAAPFDLGAMFDDFIKTHRGGAAPSAPGVTANTASIDPLNPPGRVPLTAEEIAARANAKAWGGAPRVASLNASMDAAGNSIMGGAKTIASAAAPEVAAAEAPGMMARGFGAVKNAGSSAWGVAKPLLRAGLGGLGVVGTALSAEDIASDGLNTGNALGLGAGLATAGAAAFPAAAATLGPVATLLGVGATGYNLGQSLPDSVTTRMASLAGRLGWGAGNVGGKADIAPSIMGPEAVKFSQPHTAGPIGENVTADNATGRVIPDPVDDDRGVGAPPPDVLAAHNARIGGTRTAPGIVGGSQPIGDNAWGVPANSYRSNTVRAITAPDGSKVYTNFGAQADAEAPPAAPAQQGFGGSRGYVRSRDGWRPSVRGIDRTSENIGLPINPQTGHPYSSMMNSDPWDTNYWAALRAEKRFGAERAAGRLEKATQIRADSAERIAAAKVAAAPVMLPSGVGPAALAIPGSGTIIAQDASGKYTEQPIKRAVIYSPANAQAVMRRAVLENGYSPSQAKEYAEKEFGRKIPDVYAK